MNDDDLPATKQIDTGGGAGELERSPAQATAAVERGSYRSIPRTTLPAPLGPFILERRIGLGGMAEVFLARKDGPAGFSKQIVVKRILPHLAEDQRFVDMFLREAQTAAELNHSNIVQVYELGETDGQYYIAMEYVEGVALYKLARRAWHAGRSIPMEVILRAIADAALGLDHAHSYKDASGKRLGLVHRDISPDNLIINRQGMTKVLDFGIAKGTDSRGITKTGELKGKIPYMSPEQIRGEPLDGRSDLYSLGVTLYWLLTGHRPFDGATELMTLQGVLSDEAKAPSLVNAHIPPPVDDIVLSLLAKNARHRPATGAALYDSLMSLASARSTESTVFVGDIIDLADSDAPASVPGSGGFVPSTPLTTRLSSAERQAIRKAPDLQQRSRQRALAAMAGGIGAVVLVALAVFLVVANPEPPDTVTILPAIAATPNELSKPPKTTVTPVVSQPSEEARAQAPIDDDADGAGKKENEEVEATVDGMVEESASGTKDNEKTAAVIVTETAAANRARSPQRKQGKKRRSVQVASQSVTTKAPAGVSWSVPGGGVVGRGAGRVTVPGKVDSLLATTPSTLGKARVRIVNGTADYQSLSSGRLTLRVFPYAKVTVGKKVIGTTPLPPIPLLEGAYTVKLEHEGKVVKRTVRVEPGNTTNLKVDMREE